MRVGAIVLHYRFWPGINDTLDALAHQTYPLECVVVVDNNSADGSVERLRARSDVDVLPAATNGGYAAGMNLGIRHVSGRPLDALLLLTHEAALSPDGLASMVAELQSTPELGAVGPLLVWRDRPDTVYSAGVRIDPRRWSTHHLGVDTPVDSWAGHRPHHVDSLDGAAVLLRRAAIEQTGQFNEDYFLYYEEVDYFARMRRRGWKLACVPEARAVQQPGTPPQALWTRNRLRFVADNAPRRVLARVIGRTSYDAARDLAKGYPGAARDRISGVIAFLSGRPAVNLAERR